MARDQIDMTPIETRDELVAWLEAGSKPKTQFRVGTEHEKFAFTKDRHAPVPYDGAHSIRAGSSCRTALATGRSPRRTARRTSW